MQTIRSHFPDVIISVDTFRSCIAEQAIANGANIINDVYGGDKDENMWNIIAKYHVPYVLTHAQPQHYDNEHPEANNYIAQLLDFFQKRLDKLHQMGVADVIIDPGFGFSKTIEQQYHILRELDTISILNAPILAGISRKSMLYKPLGMTAEEMLPATIAANTIALEKGAKILRVHDVAAAKQAIAIHSLTNNL